MHLIDTDTAPAKLVTFGNGGDTVHFTRGCCSQGYGSPERPHAADPANKNIPDGTPPSTRGRPCKPPAATPGR